MNYKEFHRLPIMKEQDKKDKADGLEIDYIKQKNYDTIPKKPTFLTPEATREELYIAFSKIFQGLDDNIINGYVDTAIQQKLTRDKVQEFADKIKSESKEKSGLKVETLDASAAEVTQEAKKDFVEKVSTPTATISSPNTQPTNGTVTRDDEAR